jgi:hypothetical protein
MKRMILLLAVSFGIASVAAFAGTLDAVLAEKIAENPQAKYHVIAFLQDKLDPEKVVQDMRIGGDEIAVTQQVVDIFKDKIHSQIAWLKDSRAGVEDFRVHELVHAVSYVAPGTLILGLAQLDEFERTIPYSEEALKPPAFFLKRPYFEFKSYKLTKVGEGREEKVEFAQTREGEGVDIDQIINILKKIWDFVKENKPVVNTAVDVASAVPQGITSWQQLAGWQQKHTGQYIVEYVNGFGITVVKIVLRIHFYYRGNYNGVGRYITCATASIDEMNVLWGYTLNASMTIPDSGIVNIGTSSAPVAAMQMFVHWTVDTIIQHQEGSVTYAIDGNGNVQEY